MMTVKQLREILSKADDTAVVLMPGDDHSLVPVSARVGTALEEGPRAWTEDHGEEYTPEADYGRRVPAVIVGE